MRARRCCCDNRIGSINFGLTTKDLKQRDEVMLQGVRFR
jgi:hypothetical protein